MRQPIVRVFRSISCLNLPVELIFGNMKTNVALALGPKAVFLVTTLRNHRHVDCGYG